MIKKNEIEYIKNELEKIKKFFTVQKYDVVIEKTKKLLKKDKYQLVFYNYIGLSYKQLNKLDEATKIFKQALKIFPQSESLLGNIGSVLRLSDKLYEAEEYFERSLKINPNNVSTLVNYGNLKRDQNKIEEAIEIYEKARSLDKNIEILLINLASTYQVIGKFDKSEEILKDLSERFPNNTLSDKLFSNFHKYETNDDHQDKMLEKIKNPNINNENLMTLSFALAKSYADQKNYKKSAEYFTLGNETKYKMFLNYNFNKIERERFETIKNLFVDIDLEKFNENNDANLIFVVGLPRSGTTLTHQIISSHSKVYGAGELPILNNFFSPKIFDDNFLTFFKNPKIRSGYIKEISYEVLKYFKEYNENLIILDKSPLNFEWIGFIKLLFPSAKIVHCTRNLKDTALSIYKNVFDGSSLPWSYNQSELVKFINLYQDLMRFWDHKLPNQIYNCNYENLVSNPNDEIPNLIKFLNLNWEENCLDHTKNDTVIKTVSISQARKPIYKNSINLNNEFTKYLDFLKKL
ncbi:tetratricopeptide repeat-containing sulfotransferase family protein [Candidatus Pelagibacter sp.]|uniref:tetratricopeptide repeat-containing sulfotransferase family protein n=1 Tax=Candidatus Pelagibacter sp. TaxID=2024849 RepID=UPI003F82824B